MTHTDVAVLMYHSISSQSSAAFEDYVVPRAVFTAQMAALADAGVQTVTVGELSRRRREGATFAGPTVAVTFDDGYLDFLTDALPVLQDHAMTATVYLTTRYVGGRSRWLAPEGESERRMLGWSDVGEISAAGIEVGAHSDTHPQMDLLTEAVLAREINVPKVSIEDRLGSVVASFAYPFGYSTRRVRDMVAQLGYDNAVAVADLVSTGEDHAFRIPRITVTRGVSGQDLVRIATSSSTAKDRATSLARGRASYVMRRIGVKKPASAALSRSMT